MHDLHPDYLATMMGNELFDGIQLHQVHVVLTYLNARNRQYDKGANVMLGHARGLVGVVLQGCVKVTYYDEALVPMALDKLSAGCVVGLADVGGSGTLSHAKAISVTDTQILWIDISPLLTPASHATLPKFHGIMVSNIIGAMSQYTSTLHHRLSLITNRTLRMRLKAYLRRLTDGGSDWVHLPLSMSELALHLNADRSSLYREIRLLKRSGALEWERRRLRVLEHEFWGGRKQN